MRMRLDRHWWRRYISIIIATAGSVLMLAGIVSYMVNLALARADMKALLIIDSPHHPQYGSWVQGEFADSSGEVNLFFGNLTNAAALADGATPTLDLVGPYMYNVSYRKENVTFLDGGRRVRFNIRTTYQFENHTGTANASSTAGSPVRDINLPSAEYLLLLSRLGSESAVKFYISLVMLAKTVNVTAWSNEPGTYSAMLGLAPPLPIFFGIPSYVSAAGGILSTIRSSPVDNAGALLSMIANCTSNPLANPVQCLLIRYVSNHSRPLYTAAVLNYGVGGTLAIQPVTANEAAFGESRLAVFLFGRPATCILCTGVSGPYIVHTGKDDEQKMGMDLFETFNNISINARTHSSAPFHEHPQTLEFYRTEIRSKLLLSRTAGGKVDFRGLQTIKYVLDENFLENTASFNYTDDIPGLVDISQQASGAPIYVSLPLLVGARNYTDRVTVTPSPAFQNLDINSGNYFLIDDVTGFGVFSQISPQFNLLWNYSQLNDGPYNVSFAKWNSSIPLRPDEAKLAFLPLYVPSSAHEIHPAAAELLRVAVVDALFIRTVMVSVLMSVGVVLTFAAIAMMVVETFDTAVAKDWKALEERQAPTAGEGRGGRGRPSHAKGHSKGGPPSDHNAHHPNSPSDQDGFQQPHHGGFTSASGGGPDHLEGGSLLPRERRTSRNSNGEGNSARRRRSDQQRSSGLGRHSHQSSE